MLQCSGELFLLQLHYFIEYNAHFMINFAGFVKEQETKMVRTNYSPAYHIHVHCTSAT